MCSAATPDALGARGGLVTAVERLGWGAAAAVDAGQAVMVGYCGYCGRAGEFGTLCTGTKAAPHASYPRASSAAHALAVQKRPG